MSRQKASRLRRKPLRVESLEKRMLLAADGIADVVLTNAAVYSVDPSQAWESSAAEAIAIDDNQIMAIGTNLQMLSLATNTTLILDLDGRMVLPGFHDVHTHILEAFSAVNTVSLDPGTPLRDLLPALSGQEPHAATGWVLGGGQTIDQFFDLTELPKDILDEAIPDVPAAMLEATSHSIWVNSVALSAAGISNATPNPAGGIIDRDPDTGEATGLLIDNAVDLVLEIALAQNAQLDELNYQGLLAGVETFNQFGITSVADARVYTSRGHDDVWRRAETEDALTVRANLGLWAYPQRTDDQQIAALTALYSNDADRLVKINEIKLYSDGITDNGTALLIDAYDTPGFAGDHGLSYFDADRMERYIEELENVGFTFNIHAIGDQGVRNALTAIENAGETNTSLTDRRHRITHAEIVDLDDYDRFAAADVIADFQVGGDILNAESREFLRALIGDRADSILPVRSLHDAGATVVFSSDFDVNSANPFVGIQQSLTRDDGQQLADVKDAIEAYTINAAFAMRQDDVVGSLSVGKLADLIVLDQNLFDVAPAQIDQTNVLLTLMDGENVHGDALSLTLASGAISENQGSTVATVSRVGTSGDLEILLTSSDASEATVPTSVIIPDGQTSATFLVTGVNDDLNDASRRVTITAEAAGMITSIALLTVINDDPNGVDYGDAPTALQSGFFADYPVRAVQGGATHVVGFLRLGRFADAEIDGQPSAKSVGDDLNGDNDDEDGSAFETSRIVDINAPTVTNFSVVSSASGKLDVWIDLNQNGSWAEFNEKVADSVDVVAGVNTISFTIPADSLTGSTAVRIRLSSQGGLQPVGAASDGEVEDEWVTFVSGAPSLNAKVTTSFNTTPTDPVVIASADGRTSITHLATEFFDAANTNFGGLSIVGAPQDETFAMDLETLSVPSRGFTINGGGGDNQLRVGGDAVFSLLDGFYRLANLDIIDLTADGDTTFEFDTLTIRPVLATNPVKIQLGPNDKIDVGDVENWRYADSMIEDGQFTQTIQNVVSGKSETIQLDSLFPWHNALLSQDVDNSGAVTPNDILEVINQLVDRSYIQSDSDTAVSPTEVDPWPNRFYDTTGNNQFTPADILEVIEFLAEQRANMPLEELIDLPASPTAEFVPTNTSDFLAGFKAQELPPVENLAAADLVQMKAKAVPAVEFVPTESQSPANATMQASRSLTLRDEHIFSRMLDSERQATSVETENLDDLLM